MFNMFINGCKLCGAAHRHFSALVLKAVPGYAKHAPFIVHLIIGRAKKGQTGSRVHCPGSASNQKDNEGNY